MTLIGPINHQPQSIRHWSAESLLHLAFSLDLTIYLNLAEKIRWSLIKSNTLPDTGFCSAKAQIHSANPLSGATLGKPFAECYTRQRAHDKFLVGKMVFAECFLSSTRQRLCWMPNIRQRWKWKNPKKEDFFFRRLPSASAHPPFFHDIFRAKFKSVTSLSHTSLNHYITPSLYLYCVSVPHILYQITYKLIIWAPK